MALAICRLYSCHTLDGVAELVYEVHGDFGLTLDKIFATVTDHASNFIAAFRIFGFASNVDPEEDFESFHGDDEDKLEWRARLSAANGVDSFGVPADQCQDPRVTTESEDDDILMRHASPTILAIQGHGAPSTRET